jgi:bacterioferritin-associated ferredoxin
MLSIDNGRSSRDLTPAHSLVEIERRLEIQQNFGGCAKHAREIQGGVRSNITFASDQLA